MSEPATSICYANQARGEVVFKSEAVFRAESLDQWQRLRPKTEYPNRSEIKYDRYSTVQQPIIQQFRDGYCTDIFVFPDVVIGGLPAVTFGHVWTDSSMARMYDSANTTTLTLRISAAFRETFSQRIFPHQHGWSSFNKALFPGEVSISGFSWLPVRVSTQLAFTIADENGQIERIEGQGLEVFLYKAQSTFLGDAGVKITTTTSGARQTLEITIADFHVKDVSTAMPPDVRFGLAHVATERKPSSAVLKKLEDTGLRKKSSP